MGSGLKMKIDIHNHILPKEWPNLKEVGNFRAVEILFIEQLYDGKTPAGLV